MKKIPPTLFKYEKNCDQVFRNFDSQVIYFGSPSKFNDPFDCALWPQINPPSPILANTIAVKMLELGKGPFQREMLEQFEKTEHSEWCARLMNSAEKLISDRLEDIRAKHGISCFSERNHNILMWSHYASHHEGFCLEFHTASDLFTKARAVVYTEEVPTVDLRKIMLEEDFEIVLDLFCTKSLDWEYEREWRVLRQEVGPYRYPPKLLKSIYFGAKASQETIDRIFKAVIRNQLKVDLHQGRLSKSKFEIEFDQVESPMLESLDSPADHDH